MSAWRRYVLTFVLGVSLPIVAALYAGGERVAIVGIKLAAIENGFQLASRSWTFDAVPDHEPEALAQAEPDTVKKPGAKRR